MTALHVVSADGDWPDTPSERWVTVTALRNALRSGSRLRMFRQFDEVVWHTPDGLRTSRPLLAALLTRALSRGGAYFEPKGGARECVSTTMIAALAARAVRDAAQLPIVLRTAHRTADQLLVDHRPTPRLSAGPPLYLRTDLVTTVLAGGSVAHTAGVINSLSRAGDGPPVFVTTGLVPTVDPAVEWHLLRLPERFWDFQQVPSIVSTNSFMAQSLAALADRRPSFVYQRYSMNNLSGALLGRRLGVPFVLEFNGSEVWINRAWGQPRPHEKLSELIETANLRSADLVVVVSDVLAGQVAEQGVTPDRILVNPNGVDVDRYSPSVSGTAVRQKYELDGCVVFGFIGTFGRWHGADILVRAFARLVKNSPELHKRARLLMVGDGVTYGEAVALAKDLGVADSCVFTGLVPHEEGPSYLAACDVLVSPHVPNADGSRFFGSPTKLFEYMAMGRAIVASDLDQIGQILRHEWTAWLTAPGDPDSLAEGMRVLSSDAALRDALGRNARDEAVKLHSWDVHVARILAQAREVAA